MSSQPGCLFSDSTQRFTAVMGRRYCHAVPAPRHATHRLGVWVHAALAASASAAAAAGGIRQQLLQAEAAEVGVQATTQAQAQATCMGRARIVHSASLLCARPASCTRCTCRKGVVPAGMAGRMLAMQAAWLIIIAHAGMLLRFVLESSRYPFMLVHGCLVAACVLPTGKRIALVGPHVRVHAGMGVGRLGVQPGGVCHALSASVQRRMCGSLGHP